MPGRVLRQLPPPLIFSDCRGALDICDNRTNYHKAKLIDIRYHFIRHVLQEAKISIDHIPGTEILLMLSQRRSILSNINTISSL